MAIHYPSKALLGALCCFCGMGALNASNVVVSNLGETNTPLFDSKGVPLAIGSMIQLVTFGELSAEEIVDLAESGTEAIAAVAVPFGAPTAVGVGDGGVAGTFEFLSEVALTAPLGDLHLMIFNEESPATSTEVLVARIIDAVPADDLSGVPGYLAVHLDSVELVFGSESGDGFSTAIAAVGETGFEAWILAQLGEGANPEDLQPDADVDHDGSSNFTEYAFGSGAQDSSSIPQVRLRRSMEDYFVQYLKRSDDPGLVYESMWSENLEADAWQVLTSEAGAVLNPTNPAPDGFAWVEQLLPSGEGRMFTRVEVESAPAP